MSAQREHGILALFDAVDAVGQSVEVLRGAGFKRITAFAPFPSHELEHALHAPESPVRIYTLVGGLTGTASGFALAVWTSLDWPLVTGGKPIISLPAFVVIAFELTILFGALSTIAGLFINARLSKVRPQVVYDATFSQDRFGVLVDPPSGREAEVRELLEKNGAVEIRAEVREVQGAAS